MVSFETYYIKYLYTSTFLMHLGGHFKEMVSVKLFTLFTHSKSVFRC